MSRKPNRRQFIRSSIAAAAGGSALFHSRAPTYARAIGANNRLRIAVAGLNGRGGSHIGGWLGQDNVEIVSLIDPDENVLRRAVENVNKKQGGMCRGFKDVRKALEDPELDAISIATPNHWHSLMTIWGAQAGKHVYVEKPMSHDIAEGRVAVEAQKKYGVVVQHGTQQRSSAGIAGLHEAIKAGKFGKLKISYGYCCKPRGGIGFKEPADPPAEPRLEPLARPGRDRPVPRQLRPLQLALVLEDRQRRPEQPGHPPARRRPLGDRRRPDPPGPRDGDRRPVPVERPGRDAQHDVRHGRVSRTASRSSSTSAT